MLRSVGRQYDAESQPRWHYGWMRRRDGTPLWRGAPDPLLPGAVHGGPPDLGLWAAAFAQACEAQAIPLSSHTAPDASWHHFVIDQGSADSVLGLGLVPVDSVMTATVVLPAFPDVDAFLERSRATCAAAEVAGLHPLRLYFDGTVADAGGGGQITLGGASPERSVFVLEPAVLPWLVRFVAGHPSLSHLFCHDFLGGHEQSARADERGTDAFDELALALERLDRLDAPDARTVAANLGPLLRDAAGNAHRAELNIEKFFDTGAPPRGMQGLVEFRAMRMQHTPQRATALACLLRAVVALLATSSRSLSLVNWGTRLHQRFALPFYLEEDLVQVLDELRAGGFGLAAPIVEVLQRDEFRHWSDVALPGAVLELRRALEFWPLVGDVAGSDPQGSITVGRSCGSPVCATGLSSRNAACILAWPRSCR